jgi:hypothetical protein
MGRSTTKPEPHGKAGKRAAVAIVALLAIGMSVAAATRVPTRLRMRDLKSSNPKVRRAALRELGGREGYAAIPAIRAMIAADPDPSVRSAAAYAAMKLGDTAAAQSIQRAIREGPDHETTAEMLATLARLCGPDADSVAFINECAQSRWPYRIVGAAMARAEWFQPEGVDELMALGQSGPEESRGFARDWLRQYLIPPAQMAGVRFDTSRGRPTAWKQCDPGGERTARHNC